MHKVRDRQLFRQFCEEAEQDRQDAIIEREEADDLRAVASEILSHFDLHQYAERFLSSATGLALLANCCNCAAKWYDDDLYAYKPMLILLAALHPHADAWQQAGIVYIETEVGQVSFHALQCEDAGLPEANGRTWSGVEYQFNAPLVAQAFIEEWSKECLIHKIQRTELVA